MDAQSRFVPELMLARMSSKSDRDYIDHGNVFWEVDGY